MSSSAVLVLEGVLALEVMYREGNNLIDNFAKAASGEYVLKTSSNQSSVPLQGMQGTPLVLWLGAGLVGVGLGNTMVGPVIEAFLAAAIVYNTIELFTKPPAPTGIPGIGYGYQP